MSKIHDSAKKIKVYSDFLADNAVRAREYTAADIFKERYLEIADKAQEDWEDHCSQLERFIEIMDSTREDDKDADEM